MNDQQIDREKLILGNIWQHGPISRKKLSSSLDINLPAVSITVQNLLHQKHIEEVGSSISTGGRKPQMVDIAERSGSVLTASIANQEIKTAISDMKSNLSNERLIEYPENLLPKEIIDRLFSEMELQKKYVTNNKLPPLKNIGVVMCGIVDEIEGVSVRFPRVEGWDHIPLRHQIEQRFKLPTILSNRENAVTHAEKIYGQYSDYKDFMYINVGCCIGMGLSMQGKILRNDRFAAGHLGCVTVVKSGGHLCHCGNYGCLETIAGEPALVREAKQGLRQGVNTRILEFVEDNKIENIDPIAIFEAAVHKDRFALNLINKVGEALSVCIANLVNLFAPKMIILGGRMMGEILHQIISEQVHQRALASFSQELKIELGSFETQNDLKGAATIALLSHYHPWNGFHRNLVK